MENNGIGAKYALPNMCRSYVHHPQCVSYLNSIRKKDRLVEGMYYITTHIVSRRKLFLYKARMKNGP